MDSDLYARVQSRENGRDMKCTDTKSSEREWKSNASFMVIPRKIAISDRNTWGITAAIIYPSARHRATDAWCIVNEKDLLKQNNISRFYYIDAHSERGPRFVRTVN